MEATWIEAKTICKTFNMELASFKTLEEANTVMDMVRRDSKLAEIDFLWMFLDGIALSPKSKTDWYWTETGEKIGFTIPWPPTQPDTADGNEFYLSFGRFTKEGTLAFNDLPGKKFMNSFLCQKFI